MVGGISIPTPLVFEHCTRLEKFSGRTGDNDFEVWVEDFKEATTDCGWNDQLRARWFAWFLAGPAKSTWQRTLTSEDKKSWSKIVEVYRGQWSTLRPTYGISEMP